MASTPDGPAPALDPLGLLSARFRAAIGAAYPDVGADVDPLIAPGKQPEFGDYQCNAAMSLAKRVGEKPRDVASKMTNTPGYFRFLKNTGHSIDTERPVWMAQQIVDFLR